MKIKLNLIDLPTSDLRASIDEDALDELADSLRESGQLQPIGVSQKEDGRFEVIFGARRTRAANLLGWSEIEATIRTTTERENTRADKLIENVQRQDLTPIEEAYGLIELIGDGETDVRKLQRQTGKSRAWILTRLHLVEMPEDLQGAVQAGVIGLGVAKALATIENAEIREQYTRHAAENGCTEDQATIWASQAKFAEQGIMAMDALDRRNDELRDEPQIVDQQYSCFICRVENSWRRVNTLVICGTCQEAVTSSRHTLDADPIHSPLDIIENGA